MSFNDRRKPFIGVIVGWYGVIKPDIICHRRKKCIKYLTNLLGVRNNFVSFLKSNFIAMECVFIGFKGLIVVQNFCFLGPPSHRSRN